MIAIGNVLDQLRIGELIILYDDINTKMGSLVGIAKSVNAHKINLMTKIGKGLVYICITEKKADELHLPFMIASNLNNQVSPFTVSVDFKNCTTGISAFERSDTIKAFTNENLQPDDLLRPGHIFPLVAKEKGLLQRVDIPEAVLELTAMVSSTPVAYMCEILNATGEIARKEEIQELSKVHGFPIIELSEILKLKKDDTLCSFSGFVIKGRQLGTKMGFPTANISVEQNNIHLDRGVYGVKVFYQEQEYVGIMNIGRRPTINSEDLTIHYEVHIFDFDKTIYDSTLLVKVCFFVREEVPFLNLDSLINQITKDIRIVNNRFNLVNLKMKV